MMFRRANTIFDIKKKNLKFHDWTFAHNTHRNLLKNDNSFVIFHSYLFGNPT